MDDGSSDSIPWLRQRLGAAIQEVAVQGDRPLVLDDPRHAYLTLSEHHQLFCVGYREGRAHGRREHLALCRPGQLVFGVEMGERSDSTALLLSGITGSVVWRMPVAALAKLAEARDGARVLGPLFDSWIELLIEALPGWPVPTRCRSLKPGETIELLGDPVRAAAGVVWIAPSHPPAFYGGVAPSRVPAGVDCWPLTTNTWALCPPESKYRVWSTAELLGNDASASFAQGFVGFVLAISSRRRTELARHRIERDHASLEAESGQLASSLGKLARVGRAQRLSRALETGAGDFSRALAVVHEAVAVPPPKIELPDAVKLSQVQAALAQSTGARSRPVLLEGTWWTSDGGPLLGFVMKGEGAPAPAPEGAPAAPAAEEKFRPVALLPADGGYNLYDPLRAGSKIRKVDAALAEGLHPQAHQFYRPLPPGKVTLLGMLRMLGVGAGRDLLRVGVVGLLVGLLGLLIPMVTGIVFDRIVPGAERPLLLQIALVLLAVYLGSSLFDVAQGLALVRMQTRLDAGIEAAVWDRLLRLPLAFFRKYSAGDLSSRAAGISGIREALAGATTSSILSGIFSVWNLVLLFALDIRLALAAAGLVGLATLVGALASALDLSLRRKLTAADGKIGGLLLQIVNGIAKLRVARAERRAFGVWANMVAKRRSTELGIARIDARVSIFHAVYPILCTGVLFYLLAGGAGPPLHGPPGVAAAMTTGTFLAFYSAFSALLRAALDLLGAGLTVVSVIPLYERAKPIFNELPESEGATGVRTELSGQIELSHVSFRYAADGPLVLDDVSLRIEPGEFVAVVGPSGSGKSTLLRLLLGFEAPTEGGLYYDGQALSSLDVRAARQQIGVVLQQSDVMSGDIFTNIVGSTGGSMEDAWAAARLAAFDRDVEAMPMGMHTVLSQGRSTLSGGQRQRLLIARALAARPKILFFDEATSALDNETQALVSRSLEGLRVTRVVIAHRLSTIQHAEKIIVLERGRIVEMGGFAELLAKNGAFSALARRQMV
jgi:NHLM bacteriocin system ABC transporter ATP-binding protein